MKRLISVIGLIGLLVGLFNTVAMAQDWPSRQTLTTMPSPEFDCGFKGGSQIISMDIEGQSFPIDVAVQHYSTGFFQNGIRTVAADPETQYCALSTMTRFINLVSSSYCTIKMQNGVFVLTGYAAPNTGVNCSMTCFSSDRFNR